MRRIFATFTKKLLSEFGANVIEVVETALTVKAQTDRAIVTVSKQTFVCLFVCTVKHE